MKFDINKIPIKYIIGSYIDEEGYPSPSDIIYLATKRAADKGKNVNNLSFTSTAILKKIGKDKEESFNNSLDILLQKSIIEFSRETKTGKSYKILKNKFI